MCGKYGKRILLENLGVLRFSRVFANDVNGVVDLGIERGSYVRVAVKNPELADYGVLRGVYDLLRRGKITKDSQLNLVPYRK